MLKDLHFLDQEDQPLRIAVTFIMSKAQSGVAPPLVSILPGRNGVEKVKIPN